MFIRDLIAQVNEGRIRIPAFQRGFVWDSERVAQLMDSIYKEYPFGSLLFWRTKAELKAERTLGPFKLPKRPDDYPVDYVLDGQQRLTSIFTVFQTTLEPSTDSGIDWTDIYFDFDAAGDVQESQFVALKPEEVDDDRHFPLKVIFDTGNYGTAVRSLPDDKAAIIDGLWTRFNQLDIPVQTFTTDDKTGVAIVFERVNRLGMELDTLQLLSAWTWSDDFDLQTRFQELADDLEPFGFQGVGEDITLLLRCCAAVVDGDASPTTLMSLNGSAVRDKFPEIVAGIKGAIDYVRDELGVVKLDNLPHSTVLVPLSVFFAAPERKSVTVSESQNTQLKRWFWRACFSSRYGRVVQRNLKVDVQQMMKLKAGEVSTLDEIVADVDADFFLTNRFNLNTVASKTFVLLLAQQKPRSLVSGKRVKLSTVLSAYNRNEFHHLYPQKFLRAAGVSTSEQSYLANMCFISAIDNKTLGGSAPSAYKAKLAQNNLSSVLARAAVPEDELFADDYEKFLKARAERLADLASELID